MALHADTRQAATRSMHGPRQFSCPPARPPRGAHVPRFRPCSERSGVAVKSRTQIRPMRSIDLDRPELGIDSYARHGRGAAFAQIGRLSRALRGIRLFWPAATAGAMCSEWELLVIGMEVVSAGEDPDVVRELLRVEGDCFVPDTRACRDSSLRRCVAGLPRYAPLLFVAVPVAAVGRRVSQADRVAR